MLTFGDRQGRTPLVSENVQADAAIGIDIWVIDASREVDFGWLERVIGWEMN